MQMPANLCRLHPAARLAQRLQHKCQLAASPILCSAVGAARLWVQQEGGGSSVAAAAVACAGAVLLQQLLAAGKIDREEVAWQGGSLKADSLGGSRVQAGAGGTSSPGRHQQPAGVVRGAAVWGGACLAACQGRHQPECSIQRGAAPARLHPAASAVAQQRAQVRRQVRRGCSALTAAAPAAAAGGGGICGVLNWRQQGQRDEGGAVCRQADCLLNAIGVRHQVSAVGGQPCRERACQLGPGRASAQRGMERDARIHA
jgi:hypothetical protein